MGVGQRVVVVGAGHAGGRAVEALRANGHAGPIDLVGAEPHLPYERPPLSKDLLTDSAATLPPIREADWYAAEGVGLHLGDPAVGLDLAARTVQLESGGGLAFDRLLLTTGGRVRRLGVPGANLRGVHYLRTIEDSRAVRAHIERTAAFVVVGGGFIGLEVAAAARSRGCAVTVLEAAGRLLARGVPPEVAAVFADAHRRRGVDLRLNTGVRSIEGRDGVAAVLTTSGERIDCAAVVVGIGIVPETTLAEAAGLAVAEGIVVDEYTQTSDPAVFAAGDATVHPNVFAGRCLRLESWQNAQNQAIAAARNICGEKTAFQEVPWFWSDQYDLNLQILGAPAVVEDTVVRGDLAAGDGILFQFARERLVGAVGVNRPRDMRILKRLMAAGGNPAPAQLADEAMPLRSLS